MISVVIASELKVIREGMKRILCAQHGITISGEVEQFHELTKSKEIHSSNVLVIANPVATHADSFLLHLQENYPSLRVIVVTRSPTLQQILVALRLGVRGLLNASCAANHLPIAIRTVCAGRVYLHEDVSRIVAQDLHGLERDHTHRSLTAREMDIFIKLASGMKVTEIAAQLGISVKTVSTHKGRIMEKMGMTSYSELVQYAVVHQLFDAAGGLSL